MLPGLLKGGLNRTLRRKNTPGQAVVSTFLGETSGLAPRKLQPLWALEQGLLLELDLDRPAGSLC